jgi:diguanylate cyclase (GGDEF)-like protein
VLLCATLCVAALTLSGVTTRADRGWYELLLAQPRERADRDADADIVIVAIDDRSLAALGRWPWPRRIHAELVARLAQVQARGVMLDILFSEPDHGDPAGDAALAKAIAGNGRVALPVTATAVEPGGPPIELLPMPALASAAAALGHVEVVVDDDGVARRAHLRAGLGNAHWPALALALIEAGGGDAAATGAVGLRADGQPATAPHRWHRDREIMIPYTAGRGFAHVSYIDVLRGKVDDALLKGRWILVGVTAPGIGDTIQTPMPSGHARIPGVVYQAHLLDSLLHGEAVTALSMPLRVVIGTLLVLLPAALLLRGRPRRIWLVVPAAAVVAAAASAAMLYGPRLWFPPMPALYTLLAGAAAWALYEMRQSQRHAHYDTLTRLANRRLFDDTLHRELNAGDRRALPLSLLLIDVDHFKHYNDTYGHQAGDDILRQVARAIATHARRGRDLPARYGGDELAVILPRIDAAAAQAIADAIVVDVRALAIPHAGSEIAATVTVSIGVAEVRAQHERRADILVGRADIALYRAKQLGRNRSYLAHAAYD